MQILAEIAISLVAVEFAVHLVYFIITGKGGIEEPPFDYLKDIYKAFKKWQHSKKHCTDYSREVRQTKIKKAFGIFSQERKQPQES